MWRTASTSGVLSTDDLPELALATAFEREIMNARIHFIYHVTVQKPGALEAGWDRYGRLRALMPKLQRQVANSTELYELRQPTATLAADLDRYEVILRQILDVVAKHQNSGPEFTALVAQWAEAGGKLVKASGDLSAFCAERANAASLATGTNLRRLVFFLSGAGLMVTFIGLMLGRMVLNNITGLLKRVFQNW